MNERQAGSLVGRAALTGAAVAAVLGACVWMLASPGGTQPAPTPRAPAAAPPAPILKEAAPAANRAGLVLSADARKVLGWISGTGSHAGREVTVRLDGRTETVIVQRDNTFTWYYSAAKPAEAAFAVAGLAGAVKLAPAEAPGPSAFFVVDRTAYRPGQTLNFVAFLRQLDPAGRFEPVAGREVEVELRSVKKQSLAAKIKLTSDDFGRIAGSYAFMPADNLDEYALAIPAYKGQGRCRLAEFRKAKVRLEISAEQKDGKCVLKFEALDFLKQPVPAERVQFTARVVRQGPARRAQELTAAEFVYHAVSPADELPDDLSEEQLLSLAAGGGLWSPAGDGPVEVAQLAGEIRLDGKSSGSHTIDLPPAWRDGQHAVSVTAVLVDQNNHEQRAGTLVPLAGAEAGGPGAGPLALALDKRVYACGETIRLGVAAAGGAAEKALAGPLSVVVMRLTPRMHAYGAYYPQYQNIRSAAMVPWNYAGGPRVDYSQLSRFEEALVTAVAVRDGAATVKLADPGAYRLVAVGALADGSSVRGQIGCIVRQAGGEPALVLRLDKAECTAGGRLTGEVHSRFRGARLLLTVRDSGGIRMWRTIDLAGTAARLDEPLPGGFSYGCVVAVHYVDEAGRTHAAQGSVRIVPADRMLEVRTEVKETCEPGEAVRLRFRINRREPVDLAVSVYDQSLLGVAADRSVDIRNFYLADERAFAEADALLLVHRLGGVTVEELLPKIAKYVEANPASPLAAALRTVPDQYRSGHLPTYQIAALLDFIGIRTAPAGPGGYSQWYCRLDRSKGAENMLADLVRQTHSGAYRLAFRWYDDLLVVGEADVHTGRLLRYWPYYAAYRGGLEQFHPAARARGDAHYSLSGNAFQSLSGQSFISHLPDAGDLAGPSLPDGTEAGMMVRRDFSDSAFWNGCVRTDADGVAEVAFKLPDSLTNWRVVVTAVSRDMHVGQAAAGFRTYRPVMVWPMIPRNFTQGDKVRIFARVHNRTEASQTVRVALAVENGQVIGPKDAAVVVAAGGSETVYWTFQPGQPGYTQVLMTAQCPAGSDASLKRLPVVPACSVVETIARSGFCEGEVSFDVPAGVDLPNARLEVTLTPSLLADMVDTLDYLVAYPHGCVEQTMSRFLPAIKVAGVLKASGIRHEPLEKRLPECVSGGIKRLLQLQRPDGGWGWNGSGGTHEMMTPYALYGLLEAEKAGYTIGDEQAITKGLNRLEAFINAMGPAQAADRVYCMYVHAHRRPIRAEWWQFIDGQLAAGKLSDYAAALALELAAGNKQPALAGRLAAALRKAAVRVGPDCHWRSAGFSRWGDDPCEVTAAAMKALTAHDHKDPLMPAIVSYFARTKQGDRWNSTKATAMVLFAMCDYLARRDVSFDKDVTVALALNGGRLRRERLAKGLVHKVSFDADLLRHGRNVLRFDPPTAGTMYRLVLSWRKFATDAPPEAAGIRVARQFFLLDRTGRRVREIAPGQAVPRGSYIESLVTASMDDTMRYCLVTNNKPSGCEIVPEADRRFNQSSTAHVLREDATAAVLYHHESAGTQLADRSVLYAELAGEFVVPPAVVELMYRPDVHGHSGTARIRVEEERQVASIE